MQQVRKEAFRKKVAMVDKAVYIFRNVLVLEKCHKCQMKGSLTCKSIVHAGGLQRLHVKWKARIYNTRAK